MNSMNVFLSVTLLSGILAAACAHEPGMRAPEPPPELAVTAASPLAEPATALIQPGPNSGANGLVRFIPDSDGVRVVARLQGLLPNANHAIQIHTYGDCSDPGLASAGDMLSTLSAPAAASIFASKAASVSAASSDSPSAESPNLRRAGDLGNLSSDLNGVAVYERVLTGVEAPRVLVGRSIVIHQNAGDTESQTAGPSGGSRIACGVIGIARR